MIYNDSDQTLSTNIEDNGISNLTISQGRKDLERMLINEQKV